MKRIPVQSNHLKSVGYSPCASVLEIEFADGKVFQYFDIPTSIYVGLMAASSMETFFRARIEPNHGFRELG